jgi:methionyl-tRNA formyltransferase
MKFAIIGDDLYIESYKILIAKGFKLLGAWLSERDNVIHTNIKLEELCRKHNASVFANRVSSLELQNLIEKEGLELLLMGCHEYKIPTHILPKYHLNIHPSLLPEGRGSAPIPDAIISQRSKTGVTLHKITNEFDKGDIVIQREFPVSKNDTHDSLMIKSMMAAQLLFSELSDNFDLYWKSARPQVGGEYVQRQTIEQRTIDWKMSVKEINKMICAYGRLGVYIKLNNKRLIITHALCWEDNHNLAPGTIVSGYPIDVAVACKDGIVCITTNQINF